MMNAYETFHVQDPRTAELALELVETAFPEFHHPWLPSEGRGEWIRDYSNFYIVFKDGEFRGYFCIVQHSDGAFLHFGTTGRAYALADVRFGIAKARCIAANVYGIPELFCDVDAGDIVCKLVRKLGFTLISGTTYKIQSNEDT